MTNETLKKAKKLEEQIGALNLELRIWKTYMTDPDCLGMHHSSDYYSQFVNSTSEDLFNTFRTAAMNAVKIKITNLENELKAL